MFFLHAAEIRTNNQAEKRNFGDKVVKLRNARLGVNGASAVVRVIKNKSQLERLDLYQNNMRDTGIAYMCQFLSVPSTPCAAKLRAVNFGCNDAGDDAGQAIAQFIAQSPTLASVELGSQAEHRIANHITRRGLDYIARALVDHPSLEHLGLARTPPAPPRPPRDARQNRNALGAGESSIDGQFVLAQALQARPAGPRRPAGDLKVAQRNSSLTSLAVGWAGLGAAEALDMAEVLLRDNRTLATLLLSGNKLNPQVGAALGQVVRVNGALRALHLAETGLGVRGLGPLAAALKEPMCGLTTLDLEACGIETQGAAELAEALGENRTLTALNVSGNNIQPDGGVALARALARNPVLASLSANSNSLRDSTAQELAAALATPGCVLSHLELSSCKIGDAGAVALAAGAAKGGSLVVLKLRDNFVTQGNARALLDALEPATNLSTIDLRGNQLDFATLSGVDKLAKRNFSKVKAAEPEKLKDEIVRLIREKDKIADVEQELSKERAAVQVARRRVEDTYADIETTKVEGEMLAQEIDEYEKVRGDYEKQFKELQQMTEQEERQEEEFLKGVERVEAETKELKASTAQRVKELREAAADAKLKKEELIRQAILLRDELQRLREEAKAKEAATAAAAEAAAAAALAKAAPARSRFSRRTGSEHNAAVNSMLAASIKLKAESSASGKAERSKKARPLAQLNAQAEAEKQRGGAAQDEDNDDVEYDAG
eukprot:tig00000622_g2625.t1